MGGGVMSGAIAITISRHAQHRRKQMGVTEDEIRRAIANPDLMYPSGPGHPEGRYCVQQGRIVVVMDKHNEVVTVLWHLAEGR